MNRILNKVNRILFIRNIKKNLIGSLINGIGSGFSFFVLIVFVFHILFEVNFEADNKNKKLIYRLEIGDYAVSSATVSESFSAKLPEIESVVRIYPLNSTVIYNGANFSLNNVFFADSTIYNVFNIRFLYKNDALFNFPYSIVLSEDKARLIFGENDPLNKKVEIDGSNYVVSGVIKRMPENTHLKIDAIIPFSTLYRINSANKSFFYQLYFYTYLLIKPSTDINKLKDKLNTEYEEYLPKINPEMRFFKLNPLLSIRFSKHSEFDFVKHSDFSLVLISLAIAILLLLLIFFNSLIFSMARNISRIREFFIKYTLGVSGYDFFISSVIESVSVYLLYCVSSVLLYWVLSPSIASYFNITLKALSFMDVVYLFCLSVLLGILTAAGQYLLIFSQINSRNAVFYFKIKMRYFKQVLFFAQFMITTVLLIFTLHLYKQINYIYHYNPGYDKNNIVFFEINDKTANQVSQIKNKLLQMPSVQSVTCSNSIPGKSFMKRILKINGTQGTYYSLLIDKDFLKTYKIKYRKLYDLSFNTGIDSNSFMINRTGYNIVSNGNNNELKINKMRCIAVVDDFNFLSLHSSVQPLIMFFENSGKSYLSIRLASKPDNQTYDSINKVWSKLFPDEHIEIQSLTVSLKELYNKEFFQQRLLTVMTIISIVISVLGLLFLSKVIISGKSKEIAIRKVLGASWSSILWTILSGFILIILLANIVAIPISLFFLRNWLSNFSYAIDINVSIIGLSVLISILTGSLIIVNRVVQVFKTNLIKSVLAEN